MNATPQWLAKWQTKKEMLVPASNLNDYFCQPEIAGKKLALLDMGVASFPTGEVIVRDPLCYLNKTALPFIQTVPPGVYPVTACVVLPDENDCARYAAVKMTVSDKVAVRFEEALVGNENLDSCEPGSYFGFNVDAGLTTIVDCKTKDAYCRFFDRWYQENPDSNNYDHYFAEIFAESYRTQPQYQRQGGDWINWTVPETNLHMPIFQSGFGDGCYPVYFGYDENDDVCCVVVEFIDIPLAYGEDNS